MIRERTKVWGYRLLSAGGVLTVFYCLAVLGFVATAPDIGLRCLLVNDRAGTDGADVGLEIRQIVHDPAGEAGDGPQPGDRLLEIAREPAWTFSPFAEALPCRRRARPSPATRPVALAQSGDLPSRDVL